HSSYPGRVIRRRRGRSSPPAAWRISTATSTAGAASRHLPAEDLGRDLAGDLARARLELGARALGVPGDAGVRRVERLDGGLARRFDDLALARHRLRLELGPLQICLGSRGVEGVVVLGHLGL